MTRLQKRLIRTALLSSPLLAVHGVAPVFIFNGGTVPVTAVLTVLAVLLPGILAFWAINIVVLTAPARIAPAARFVASYFLTFLLFLSVVMLAGSPAPPFVLPGIEPKQILLYPIAFHLAVNTIVLLICQTVILSEKKKIAEGQVEALRIAGLEAQHQALLKQLQPHFLFNALSILKSLIRTDAPQAEQYTLRLSGFLRYAVRADRSGLMTVAEELRFAQDYLQLQQVRFEDALSGAFEVDEALHQRLLPAFALQTLVENAIKHNAFTTKHPLTIRVYSSENRIVVWNNRRPMPQEQDSGTGLGNLGERYRLLGAPGIAIQESDEYFEVRIATLEPLPA